jgi:MFS family permease
MEWIFRNRFQRLAPDSKREPWLSRISQKLVWRLPPPIAVPLITGCFCVCEFLRGVDAGVLPSILPNVSQELRASSTEAYWTGSVYLLSTTITEPVFAGFSKAVGRKKCLLFSLIVFILASALCAQAPSITWLIAARMVFPFHPYVAPHEANYSVMTAARPWCGRNGHII